MPLTKRLLAEAVGTLWLVLGGCGSAVLAAAYPELGIGFLGVALAFGLTVVTMAYAIGNVSGAHLNPAVTIGFVVGGRFPAGEAIPYILAQVIGAIGGAVLIWLIASGRLETDSLLTHRFGLADIETALTVAEQGSAIKVAIV